VKSNLPRTVQKYRPNSPKKAPQTRLYDSRRQVQKSAKLKTRETSNPKPRKGGVSCATFKRDREAFPLFRCVYIGVSGGHKLAIGGTLTRLQTGPNAISSSPRGKNSKLIIEGWCENSPQKRAKDNPPNATKIMSKCTVKKSSEKGSKRHLEIQKVP
jgi:hypothetical protein